MITKIVLQWSGEIVSSRLEQTVKTSGITTITLHYDGSIEGFDSAYKAAIQNLEIGIARDVTAANPPHLFLPFHHSIRWAIILQREDRP